ncbi:hypothetical protein NXY56_000299 [Leishmania guyanensis]
MSYPGPTSSQKGEVVGDACGGKNPTSLSLDVPSPEHAWTGVGPAHTLDDTPVGLSVGTTTAPVAFLRPPNAAAGRPLPSFAALLPTRRSPLSVDTTSSDSAAHEPRQKKRDQATVTTQLAPLHLTSKPSFPSVPGSGATAQGCGEGHEDAVASCLAHRQAHRTHLAVSPLNSPLFVPSTASKSRSRNKHGLADSMSFPQRAESPVAYSFTDLFVGLERPRLYGRRQRERLQHHRHHGRTHADDVVDVDGQASSSSFLSSSSLSLDHISSIGRHDGAFSGENTTKDEDGANTPTVYCSPQLPHWWRSIVTPVPGTRVSLRPDTCRLEFWWIDRLGSEAYEIIRIVLKHSLEGVVLRRSGKAAVVVEFRISSKLLKSTDYVVTRRSREQRDGSPSPATDANTSESPSVLFMDSVCSPAAPGASLTGSQTVCAAEAATVVQHSPSPTPFTSSAPLDTSTVTLGPVGNQHTRSGNRGSKAECRRIESAEPAARVANATTATATTTVTTTITTIAGGTSSQLTSPLCFPVSPRRATAKRVPEGEDETTPSTQAPVCTPSPRSPSMHLQQPQQSEATGPSTTLLPSAHLSLSFTGDSTAGNMTRVMAAERIGGNGEEEVDATSVNGGGGESTRSLASTNVTTNPNGSLSNVLATTMPPVRHLIQGSPPATKLDEAHDMNIIGGADDDVASREPGSPIGTQGNPCTLSHRCSSPPLQSPCDKLALTVKVSPMTTNGVESESLYNHIGNRSGGVATAGGGEGMFLVHIESHSKSKTVNMNQQRSGSPVVAPPATLAPNPLLSVSGHRYPALHGSFISDWQHDSRRSQQPPHQDPLGSPISAANSYSDTIAKVAAAAAEAARLEDATVPTTAAVAAPSQQRRATPLDTSQHVMAEDDDSVVAILTLPIAMCTPIVVVRLHAMHILHPLLRAMTLLDSPAFSASISGDYRYSDNMDTESTDEALVTAVRLSNVTPASSSARDASSPDYTGAVRIVSEAIELLKQEKSMEEAPPMTTTPNGHAPTRARDLSILYTVRSHLLFHASLTCLHDSLHDAEAAIRCCPARDHINATYEVLTANLISLGNISQVEDLAGFLRHRRRAVSPLLLRLGRVTQVMVSYASIFLRQQLPTSTLCLCVGGDAGTMQYSGTIMENASLSPHSPEEGGVLHCPLGDSPNAAGIVNPASTGQPRIPSLHPTPQPTEHITFSLSHRVDGLSSRADAAANTATPLQTHTLPCEVCPLLFGRNSRTLHAADEPPRRPPLSVSAAGADSISAGLAQHYRSPTTPRPRSPFCGLLQPGYPFRPGTDVCHRRLFLLETLLPSMNPTPVSRLPLFVSRGYCGATGRRSLHPISQPSSTRATISGGNNNATPSSVVIVQRTMSKRRVRAEDFMHDRDSMLALLAATADTTTRWGTVPIEYFCRHIRLSATRRIQKGEAVLMERPAVLMPFWPLPSPRSASASTTATTLRGNNGTSAGVSNRSVNVPSVPSCCAQCGRQRLAKPVNCPGGCHSVYCSEQCQQLALRLYHVVECGGVPPDPNNAHVLEPGDDVGARVRRAVTALQGVFSDWNSYLHQFVPYDTPSTRLTTPHTAGSPGMAPVSPSSVGEIPGHDASQHQSGDAKGKTVGQAKRSCVPLSILVVTAMRVVARLGAMLLSLALPLELLPQMQSHPAWTAERHAMIRAVARTLRQRGLMVPATTTSAVPGVNAYCTNVDPHRLLLLEVLLQQLSVPFFADFNYSASSTLWEGLRQIPCEVARSSGNPVAATGPEKPVASPVDGSRPDMFPNPPFPHAPSSAPANAQQQQQQRNWFVELTPTQLEMVLGDLHSMAHRVYQVVAKELVDVPSLPLSGAEAEENNSLEWGLPGRWGCVELLGFLNSTRALHQISDFALTSWAVVYPRDMEPPNVAAAMAADGRNVSQALSIFLGDDHSMKIHHHHHSNKNSVIANEFSHASPSDIPNTAAVPLAVISPWSCLTVDLHPILGNVHSGIIYSRFMVEHEQRRRMLAYCAAAAGRRGGDGIGGGSGNEDSFLSVHSGVSTSAATLLTGDDSARTGSLRDSFNLQLLEETARRSCSNLHLSLVYTPSKEPAVLAVAKKNITLGDVLWWESLNCREYLSALL